METKADILNELRSLSPLIAEMNKVNVFTVPQGYFDSISTTVLSCLQEEFDIFIPSEKKQLPYVPEGYFDQLAASILEKIKETEAVSVNTGNLSTLLNDIRNKNVFEVPAGYFDNLDKVIIDKIKTTGSAEELNEISPLLYNIKSKAVFEVPDGYFASLTDNILKKIKPQRAKLVIIPRHNFFIKYAVAAMITGVTALGIYKYIDKPHPGINNANNNAIVTLDASVEMGKNMNDKQFNDALENLNNADIAKYLENNGDITDVVVLNNNLDESKFPRQDDYLTDETTLDNYLKEIEKTTVNN
jgi:hypothetical protein